MKSNTASFARMDRSGAYTSGARPDTIMNQTRCPSTGALGYYGIAGAEDGILQCRERFQALIEAQTRNYLSHGERAQQAVRAKKEFVSNISHELRTPMHSSQLLEDGHGG